MKMLLNDFLELDANELLAVNGGYSSSSSSGGYNSVKHYGGNSHYSIPVSHTTSRAHYDIPSSNGGDTTTKTPTPIADEKEDTIFFSDDSEYYKQRNIENIYGYEYDTMCLATSIINSYVEKGITDEEISSVMKDVKGDSVQQDGYVSDFADFSKALAESAGEDTYTEYVYDPKDNWNQVVLSVEEFTSDDNKYSYGIAECYEKGGESNAIIHYMLVKNTGEIINPGCVDSNYDYEIRDIKPVQQCRL